MPNTEPNQPEDEVSHQMTEDCYMLGWSQGAGVSPIDTSSLQHGPQVEAWQRGWEEGRDAWIVAWRSEQGRLSALTKNEGGAS